MMVKNNLGQTGLHVSVLGLGTVKFGRNSQVKYPHTFELPSDQIILELLSVAKEFGINLLDTAPAYGESEERLGKLLKNRHEWILSTKVGEEFIDGQSHYDFSSTHAQKSIERSLKKLKTDFLDIVLVHSNGDDKKIIQETDIFETLSEMKKTGKIRAFGMSTKTVEGGLLALAQSDIAMVTYNPIETNEKSVIEYAHKNQKGIFIKKAFASGHLKNISEKNPIETALQFILKEPGISSIIIGTINKDHLQEAKDAIE